MLIPYYVSSPPPPVTDSGLGGGSPAIYSAPPPRVTGLGGLDELIEKTREIANETIETTREIEEEIADIIRDSGYGVRVVTSGCTTTIEHIPRAGSGEAPHVYISYVNPACREKEPPPPPPEPDGNSPRLNNVPPDIPYSASVKAFVYYGFTINSSYKEGDYRISSFNKSSVEIEDVECPGRIYRKANSSGTGFVNTLSASYFSGYQTNTFTVTSSDSSENTAHSERTPLKGIYEGEFPNRVVVKKNNITLGEIRSHASNVGRTPGDVELYAYTGEWGLILEHVTQTCQRVIDQSYSFGDETASLVDKYTAEATFERVFSPECVPYDSPTPPSPDRRPPPPPPPPPRKCCMGCCPSNSNNINEPLLQQILALLKKVDKKMGDAPFTVDIYDSDETKPEAQKKTENIPSIAEGLKVAIREGHKELKILGIDSFPIKAKANSVIPEKSGIWKEIFGFIDADEKVDIRSIADVLLWQEKRRQGEMGQWMQTIEIEDSDLTKEGEQYKKVVLPNVAESLKEVVLQNALNARTQGLVLDVALKILVEVCSTKMVSSQGTTILKDIQEYLDYTTEEKTFQVPIGISIPNKDLTAEEEADLAPFLQPSNQSFVSAEWDGKMSLSDALLDISQAVSIIRAMGFKQT